jgi:hypothetical protein
VRLIGAGESIELPSADGILLEAPGRGRYWEHHTIRRLNVVILEAHDGVFLGYKCWIGHTNEARRRDCSRTLINAAQKTDKLLFLSETALNK